MAFDPTMFGSPAPLPKKKKVEVEGIAVETPTEVNALAVEPEVEEQAEDPLTMLMGGAATGADNEVAEEQGIYTVKPEAVCYRTADKQCNSCEYFEENEEVEGYCKLLKMAVEQDAGCNAHESKAEDLETEGEIIAQQDPQ